MTGWVNYEQKEYAIAFDADRRCVYLDRKNEEKAKQEQEEKEKALQEEEAAGSQEDTAQKGVSDSNG